MKLPAAPPADAKIGKKIEYVAKRLEYLLAPMGFTRRNRRLVRRCGEGRDARIDILDLQGDKWNEGSGGKLALNLAIKFPALITLLAELDESPWRLDQAATDDFGIGLGGHFYARLGDALPQQRETWWPPGFVAGRDVWIDLPAHSNAEAEADLLLRLVKAYALPWLAQCGDLAALAAHAGNGFGSPSLLDALLSHVLRADAATARQLLLETPAYRLTNDARRYQRLLECLARYGVDVAGAAWAEPPAEPHRTRREAQVAELRQTHEAKVQAFIDQGATLAGREAAFLDAWLEEAAAKQLADDVSKFRLWRYVQEADATARLTLLQSLLETLPQPRPPVKSTVSNVYATYANFHHGAWTILAEAVLATLSACTRDAARALLQRLCALGGSVEQELTCDRFTSPLPAVLRWLMETLPCADRVALIDAAAAVQHSVRDALLARTRERFAHPPSFTFLGEKFEADLRAAFSPEALAMTERVLSECPERGFAGKDRDVLLALKRWLRTEPDGRVPLLIEDDDWGRGLKQALLTLAEPLRASVTALFEWFDEGVDSKPSQRWQRALDQHLSQRGLCSDEFAGWLRDSLALFPYSDLQHCIAAPGYGAFPGWTGSQILLGLIHICARPGFEPARRSLPDVVRAAFTVVPGQKPRAQGIGSAALPIIALDVEGKAFLQALLRDTRQKPIRASIEKALKG